MGRRGWQPRHGGYGFRIQGLGFRGGGVGGVGFRIQGFGFRRGGGVGGVRFL